MQLSECDKIVSEKYPKTHRAIQFELTTHFDGEIKTKCSIYVDTLGWHSAPTFAGALGSLRGENTNEEPQEIAV